MAIYRLKNSIQHYPWGSKTLIPDLTGIDNPDGKPFAELWMGAHPKAPSQIEDGGEQRFLNDSIAEDPVRMVGKKSAERFGGLPFLFKLLAAGEPLSIQAHPTKAQAEAGYARENSKGPDLSAPERNYKDDNHKPEILCALTTFWALRGFRPWDEIEKLAEELGEPAYLELVRGSGGDIERFFDTLMNQSDPAAFIGRIVSAAESRSGDLYTWLVKLNQVHPGDIGVAAPLYLNLVRLQPGEALYLAAGELHAYLEGLGIELMANSDNVLRGGLTVKHVDLPELKATLSFTGAGPEILKPQKTGLEERYTTPAHEFALSRITLAEGDTCSTESGGRPVILLCTEGAALIDGAFTLSPGESLFISAAHGSYTLSGEGKGVAVLYAATVPE